MDWTGKLHPLSIDLSVADPLLILPLCRGILSLMKALRYRIVWRMFKYLFVFFGMQVYTLRGCLHYMHICMYLRKCVVVLGYPCMFAVIELGESRMPSTPCMAQCIV